MRDHVLLSVLLVSCASAPAAAPTVCSTPSPPPATLSVPATVDAGRPDVSHVEAARDLLSPEPCAEGSLASVLACRTQNCRTEVVHDVTPSALAARHYRILECKPSGPASGEDEGRASLEGLPGAVWLYRGDGRKLAFLETLAELGTSAKYFNDAHFSVTQVMDKTTRGRSVLWLEWLLTEYACGGPFNGCIDTRTTTVTLCLPEAPTSRPACQDLPRAYFQKLVPSSKAVPPWAVKATFDVTVSEDGVDVVLKGAEGDWTRIDTSRVGHHEL